MLRALRIPPSVSLLVLLLIASATAGCTPVLLLGYLIGGPPMEEPDFHRRANGRDLAKAKQPVVVVCFAPNEILWENHAVDYELSRYVSMWFRRNNIKAVDPDKVRAWTDKNPDWKSPTEIGEYFKASYVVYIDLQQFSLLEENSADLYRGRADLKVVVWEMSKDGKGKDVYIHPHRSQFPGSAPMSTDQVSHNEFKQLYLTALGNEIGKLFYPVPAGDEISNRAF